LKIYFIKLFMDFSAFLPREIHFISGRRVGEGGRRGGEGRSMHVNAKGVDSRVGKTAPEASNRLNST
jgi:hypothetical protein